MAITRYYFQDPRILGPLEFLAGFGARRNQVHDIEAGAREQAQQQMGASASGAFQAALANAAHQAQQNQAFRQQVQLENLRSRNELYRQAEDDFRRSYGMSSDAVTNFALRENNNDFAAQIPQPSVPASYEPSAVSSVEAVSTGAPGAPVAPIAAPPQQRPSYTVAAPLLDPTIAPEYDSAVKQLTMYRQAAAQVLQSNKTEEEKAAAVSVLNQRMAPLADIVRRYPKPKPPSTYEDMRAAGAANGGITVAPDGSWIMPNGRGGYTRALPPKQSSAANPWADMNLPPEQRRAAALDYARAAIIPGKEIGPGYDENSDYFIGPDGKVQQFKHAKAEDGGGLGGRWDNVREFDLARRELMQERELNVNPEPVTELDVLKRMEEKRTALETFVKSPMTRSMVEHGSSMIQKARNWQLTIYDVEQWKTKVIENYGRDTNRWPPELVRMWKAVAAETAPIYENRLTDE